MGIVTGTNTFYSGASDTDKLIAINSSCKKVWSKSLNGVSWPSPALADLQGNGKLDVVTQSENGTVYALNGADGSTIWTHDDGTSGWGSVTTFQAPGADFQYVLVPTDGGVQVLDGRDGSLVTTLGQGENNDGYVGRDRNSATVTADPNGSIGITIAGGDSIIHYEVDGTSGVTSVQTKGAWPMYHHDPQLTGFTGGSTSGNVPTKPAKECSSAGVTKNPDCIG
jgi:outer membrane protein assembly factor BamB